MKKKKKREIRGDERKSWSIERKDASYGGTARVVIRVNVIDESCFVAQDKLDINQARKGKEEFKFYGKFLMTWFSGLKFRD